MTLYDINTTLTGLIKFEDSVGSLSKLHSNIRYLNCYYLNLINDEERENILKSQQTD